MFETIIISIIALFISYFIIVAAVKTAIADKMEPYFRMQNGLLTHLAKQAGMTQEEIDKIWMSEKQWRKKYQPKTT